MPEKFAGIHDNESALGMASGGVMTHHHDLRSLTMKSDKLTVKGTGITPRPTTPTHDILLPSGVDPTSPLASSRVSMTSDDEDDEANSMLQGVLTMNKVLEGQIEALRLRLQVEDKQHRDEKGKLKKDKDAVITSKETEIEDLKDSLVNRDDRIQNLVKASEEKDRQIETKAGEIDELKKLVRQTEEYAHKLHKQIGRVRHEKQNLETDSLYKEQNEEIARLSDEIKELKSRLTSMEQELHRATLIIQEQSTKIQQMEDERGTVHAKFREELDKANRAMRQEVERMREVMRQNYEEMRQLRDQNKQMHNDVKDIKDLLLKNRVFQQQQPLAGQSPRIYGGGTGVQRPLTASPVNIFKPGEYNHGGNAHANAYTSRKLSPSPPAHSPPPRGSPSPYSPNQGINTGRPLRGGGGGGGGGGGAGGGGGLSPSNLRLSMDAHSARAVSRAGQHPTASSQRPPPSARGAAASTSSPPGGAGGGGGAGAGGKTNPTTTSVPPKSFPSICSMKDEPSGLPSIGKGTTTPGQLQRAKSGVRVSTGKGAKK